MWLLRTVRLSWVRDWYSEKCQKIQKILNLVYVAYNWRSILETFVMNDWGTQLLYNCWLNVEVKYFIFWRRWIHITVLKHSVLLGFVWFSSVAPDKYQGVPSVLFTTALLRSYSSSVFITTNLLCTVLVRNGVVK